MTVFATSSMSSALSLVKGRGMSSKESSTMPRARSSKAPLRGLSALMATVASGFFSRTAFSILFARVLKAFHDLHASISRSTVGAAGAPALVLLAAPLGARFAMVFASFLGGMGVGANQQVFKTLVKL